MKKLTALLLVLLLTGCSQSGSIGIIGGSDGPTAIIVQGNEKLSSSSSQSSSSSESSSSSQRSSSPEPVPESPPAAQSSSTVSSSSSAASAPSSSSAPPAPQSQSSSTVSDNGDTAFALSSDKVKAGDYLLLTGSNLPADAKVKLECTATGSRKFFQNDSEGHAFVALSRSMTPGEHTLTVSWSEGSQTLPFTVVDAKFDTQSFEMAAGTVNDTVNSSTAREEYNRITADVMALSTGDGSFPNLDDFIMPITQETFRISSSYGFTRIVNGKVSGRHEGIDFPAPRGTPVVAAGDGRVLYSGLMQMTGNTVIIEHGNGLKSWYHHMDSLDCETDDVVSAGDLIGKVGTTGYSTGNHLHFGMSVFDTYTNPWQFIPYPG